MDVSKGKDILKSKMSKKNQILMLQSSERVNGTILTEAPTFCVLSIWCQFRP